MRIISRLFLEKFYHGFTGINIKPVLVELDNDRVAILGSPEMIEESSYSITDERNRSKTTVKNEMNVGTVMAFFPDVTGITSLEHIVIPRKIELSKTSSGGSGPVSFLQVQGISGFSVSFIAKSQGNKVVIIYNDNEENLNRSVNQKSVTSKSTKSFVLAEAVLMEDKTRQHRKQIGENIKGSATYYLGNAVQNSFPDWQRSSWF